MAQASSMRSFLSLMNRFRKDQRGNLAVIFAVATVPLISAIGVAIDYSEATRIKAKLQSAADAAAVAAISQQSSGWLAASKMTSDGHVPVAEADATNIFNGNITASASLFNNKVVTPTVLKTGPNLTSTVTFSADVPVIFMKVWGQQKLTVSGSSAASSSLPLYLDFYLTLDVSGSMGLPSTQAEQNRLSLVNPDNSSNYPTGCTFACHFQVQNVCGDGGQRYPTNSYCMGYAYSRVSQAALTALINKASTPSVPKAKPGLPNAMLPNLNANVTVGAPNSLVTGNVNSLPYSLTAATSCPTEGTDACIQLRADAVGYAVNDPNNGMFAMAKKNTVIPNQFRIGLYPFIQDLYEYFKLTTSFDPSQAATPGTINFAAANLASQLDTNTNANLGSGGTHIDTSLNTLNTNFIKNVGDGSATTKPLPYVFLVTDGAQDPQTKALNQSGGWAGSNHATTIATGASSPCKPLKDRGIKVSVLYIPYQPISPVNASFAGDEDDAANNNIPNIPPSLQACASPPDASGSYFYTATSPAQITAALTAMFNHALTTAHITN
jgi:Flp pilus assembly protein TadG